MLLGNKFSYDEFGLIHCCSAFNLCPDSPQMHKRPGISLEESQGAGWATCCRSLCLFSSVFRVCIYHQNEPRSWLKGSVSQFLLLQRGKAGTGEGFLVLVSRGGWGFQEAEEWGNVADIVKFQVFFKQSIYCVTLNPWVALGPHSLRQGVTDHFTIAA